MANKKRLSLDQVEQMKQMVQKGTAPEDIAKHFGVAISSVHNYKARFKAEGVNFPSVRGKRPTGSVDVRPSTSKTIGQIKSVDSSSSLSGDTYKFIVNGTSVQISGHAKNINIDKDSMEINF
jgi:hypothetical protein